MSLKKFKQVSAWEKQPDQAGGMRCRNVAILVTDQKTLREFDRPIRQGPVQHTGARFSIIVVTAVLSQRALWMIRTVVECIDMPPDFGQPVLDLFMQEVNGILPIIAMRDAGLIGHDKHKISSSIERRNNFSGACDPIELAPLMNIAVVSVYHAIAVQEQGRALIPARQFLTRLGQRVRKANVDEIAVKFATCETVCLD